MTGTFRSTVSEIVKDLVASGLVSETRAEPSGRGRVPVLLRVNDHGFEVVAVNVRPERTTVALAGLSAKPSRTVSFATPANPNALLTKLAGAIDNLCADRGKYRLKGIREIGVSVPGLVDAAAGRIRWLPYLPGYSDFDMAGAVRDRFGIRTAVDNDANLAVLAIAWRAQLEEHSVRDFVFVEIGTEGVGAGIIVNGELYRGHNSTLAAEFGHMVVEANGIPCGCGRRGCWERYVCDHATLQRYRPGITFSPEAYASFLRAVSDGEAAATAAFRETARYLAIGLANIGFALNPSSIVVAGHVCGAWALISPVIEEALSAIRFPIRVNQAPASADELFLKGAILLALNSVFSQPTLGLNVTPGVKTAHS